MASVTTHDLPTIAGLWSGADEAAQRAIGMTVGNEMRQLRDHLRGMLGVESETPVAEVIEAAYRRLAQAPSRIVTATLEDAQAMRRAAQHARHDPPVAQLVAGLAAGHRDDGRGRVAAADCAGAGKGEADSALKGRTVTTQEYSFRPERHAMKASGCSPGETTRTPIR